MRLFLAALCLLPILSCGSLGVSDSVYNRGAIEAVNNWSLSFSYEPGSVIEGVSDEAGQERRVITEGRSSSSLQLRDDLFFLLKDRHRVGVTNRSDEAEGTISIHPVQYSDGSFRTLDVLLYGTNRDEVWARIRIQNEDGDEELEEFSEYAAKQIARVITGD